MSKKEDAVLKRVSTTVRKLVKSACELRIGDTRYVVDFFRTGLLKVDLATNCLLVKEKNTGNEKGFTFSELIELYLSGNIEFHDEERVEKDNKKLTLEDVGMYIVENLTIDVKSEPDFYNNSSVDITVAISLDDKEITSGSVMIDVGKE